MVMSHMLYRTDQSSSACRTVSVSMGVSTLGQMDLIFIDAIVKINGASYCEVLLTLKQLPVMCEIYGEFFIVQQGHVPVHQAREKSNFWNEKHLRSFHQTLSQPTAQI